MIEFDHYDNPIRARRIWYSYRQDITTDSLAREAVGIASECKTADDLDIKLDVLLSKPLHFAGNDRPSLNDIDEDSNGGYSNARRALEEQ